MKNTYLKRERSATGAAAPSKEKATQPRVKGRVASHSATNLRVNSRSATAPSLELEKQPESVEQLMNSYQIRQVKSAAKAEWLKRSFTYKHSGLGI